MVEQNAKQALAIANRGYVLVQGENRYVDTGTALLANPDATGLFGRLMMDAALNALVLIGNYIFYLALPMAVSWRLGR